MPPPRRRLDGGQHFQHADPCDDTGQAQGRTQPGFPLLLLLLMLLVMVVVGVVVTLAGQDVGLELGLCVGRMGGVGRECGEGRDEDRRGKDGPRHDELD